MIKINKSKDNYMKYLQVAKDISSVSEIINYSGYFKLGYYLPTSDSEPENVKEDPSHSPHPSRDVKCSPSIWCATLVISIVCNGLRILTMLYSRIIGSFYDYRLARCCPFSLMYSMVRIAKWRSARDLKLIMQSNSNVDIKTKWISLSSLRSDTSQENCNIMLKLLSHFNCLVHISLFW